MSNDEFDRKMDFIVDQQAQFATKFGQLEDIVSRLANASLNRFGDVDQRIVALVDSQIRLTEAQASTREDLKNLIAVVDRHFRERNGKSEG